MLYEFAIALTRFGLVHALQVRLVITRFGRIHALRVGFVVTRFGSIHRKVDSKFKPSGERDVA